MQVIAWQNAEFSGENVVVSVLAQNESAKEIQILMPKNSQMKEHKAPFDISVQLLRGELEFSVASEKVVLKELDMVCLKANEPHSLRALKNSIVRLSLAQADSAKRVQGVLKRNP